MSRGRRPSVWAVRWDRSAGGALLYRHELGILFAEGDSLCLCLRLFNFAPMTTTPDVADFYTSM